MSDCSIPRILLADECADLFQFETDGGYPITAGTEMLVWHDGEVVWLAKPAKSAISPSIYALTLPWIFRYLPEWPALRSVTGWITSVVLVLEVGIIDVQAARDDEPFQRAPKWRRRARRMI